MDERYHRAIIDTFILWNAPLTERHFSVRQYERSVGLPRALDSSSHADERQQDTPVVGQKVLNDIGGDEIADVLGFCASKGLKGNAYNLPDYIEGRPTYSTGSSP